MFLPITLSSAAAAAVLAIWLGGRIGRIRVGEKVLHGDGGHPLLARRIRAQLNYTEYTPFVLALIAAIELAGRGGQWLAWVAAAYFTARIAHAFGMDGETPSKFRAAGVMVTLLVLAGLAIFAALVAAGVV
ncbi:MAG: MAPEG family protein [Croceibacterium sp.]